MKAVLAVLVMLAALHQPALAAPDMGKLEQRIIELTNAERAKAGLTPLVYNPALSTAARKHSDEMRRLAYFSHTSPTSGLRDVADRISVEGVGDWTAVGENIAWYRGHTLDTMAARVVKDWMNSPPHRANILGGDFTMIGVGLSFDGQTVRATQVFAAK